MIGGDGGVSSISLDLVGIIADPIQLSRPAKTPSRILYISRRVMPKRV